ncbi:MAG TPA: tetratricopeptide repeat protein [Puia sp.]|nr:tetratricopeptide repeat protein [Puia sp.]
MKNKTFILVTGLLFCSSLCASAQKEDALIRSGNRFYKQKQLDRAKQQYEKAVQQAPQNPVAQYNLGNTAFRKDEYDEAAKSYDESISHSSDNTVREKGLYNKGVAQIRSKKLEESIASWKDALKLDPADLEARENLQKALLELKQRQPPPPPEKQNQKDQKKEQKQQQSKLTKQQVEQLLKALEQKEKEVQDKMNQNKVKSLSQPDKDW